MRTSFTLAQARPHLTASIPPLLKALDEALAQWNGDHLARYQVAMDASARATILNRLTYHYAGQYLDQVVFKEDQNQRFMLFADLVVMRVKLLDSQLRARNYPTRRSTEWVRQEPLPGIPVSRLHFGYRLDPTGTILQDAFVTLPNGDRFTVNDWVWQVRGEAIEPFAIRTDLFGEEVFRYEEFAA